MPLALAETLDQTQPDAFAPRSVLVAPTHFVEALAPLLLGVNRQKRLLTQPVHVSLDLQYHLLDEYLAELVAQPLVQRG